MPLFNYLRRFRSAVDRFHLLFVGVGRFSGASWVFMTGLKSRLAIATSGRLQAFRVTTHETSSRLGQIAGEAPQFKRLEG